MELASAVQGYVTLLGYISHRRNIHDAGASQASAWLNIKSRRAHRGLYNARSK